MIGDDLKNPFDLDDDDLSEITAFKPQEVSDQPKNDPKIAAADSVSEEQGFKTIRRRRKTKKMRRSAFYQTGRSKQIPMRGTEKDYERIEQICDERDWVRGQMLTYALDALLEKIENPEDPFWEERNFSGVD